MKKIFSFIISTILILAQITIPSVSAINFEDCKDIQVIFADGSGAIIDGNDVNFNDFKDAISGVLNRTNLSYNIYELGRESVRGFKYPATPIGTGSLSDFLTTVGAYFSAGESYTYGDSFQQGKFEMRNYMFETHIKCPKTKFILGGFSQGAGVISMGMPYFETDKYTNGDNVIYAATFGDAKLYLPEGEGNYPQACRGENYSEYRKYVPDCNVYQGILFGQKPYVTNSFKGKVGAWCNHYDMICTSRINWLNFDESAKPHGSYGNYMGADRLYYDAAEVIYQKVLQEFGLEDPNSYSTRETKHNLALLIDTTGSMSSLIGQYKREAIRLSNSIFEGGGKVALYSYRDKKNENYEPILHCDFETCTPEKISEALDNLKTSGGGDAPESLLYTSMKAMNELRWEQGAVKSVVALTDAGYHKTEFYGEREIGIQEVKLRSLEIDPVNFYTITPPSIQSQYSELTSETGGKSFSSTGELEFSTEYIFHRPDVKLEHEKYYGFVNDVIIFDASQTSTDSEIKKYEWDFDMDGKFEITTSTPITSFSYNEPTSGIIQVRATDINDLVGTMSAKVQIDEKENKNQTSLIIDDVRENIDQKEAKIKFSTDAYRVLVYVNDILVGVTNQEEVTISDLDFSIENKFSFVPYGDGISYAGISDSAIIEKVEINPETEENHTETNEETKSTKTQDENNGEIRNNTQKKDFWEKENLKSDWRTTFDLRSAITTDNIEKHRNGSLKSPDCGIVK